MNRHTTTLKEGKTQQQESDSLTDNEAERRQTTPKEKITNLVTMSEAGDNMKSITVEIRRTFLTPRGRKFPPREPRTFELTLGLRGEDTELDGVISTLRQKVTQLFPRLSETYTLLFKGKDDELVPCNKPSELLGAIENMEGNTLYLFVQDDKHGHREEIECSGCNKSIQGSRTKCLQCEDYNLCSGCNPYECHRGHVMVKCDRARFFNFALPMFAPVLPELCKKYDSAPGEAENTPILTPKDVRQFWQRQRKQKTSDEKTENQNTEEVKGLSEPKVKGQCGRQGRMGMHRMWHHFLDNISSDTNMDNMKDSMKQQDLGQFCRKEREMKRSTLDVSSKPNHMYSDDKLEECTSLKTQGHNTEAGKEETYTRGQNMRTLKRQWIQKCIKKWQEQLKNATAAQSADDTGCTPNFGIWRTYMRYCWDEGQCLLDGQQDDKAEKNGEAGTSVNRHPNPRRRWMQECWQIWKEQANKHKGRDMSSDEENDHVASGNRPVSKCHGPLFPGFRPMMHRSWRLMLEQDNGGRKCSPEDVHVDEKERTPNDPVPAEQQLAKQMLKFCWINGSRKLWWMSVEKHFDLNTTNEDQPPTTHDVPDQEKLMEEMMKDSNLKSYLQECWKLWHQLARRIGLQLQRCTRGNTSENQEEQESGEKNEAQAKFTQTKKEWIRETLQMWKDDYRKRNVEQESPKPKLEGSEPKWNLRPFPGWRPMIMRSWKLMQDLIGKCTENDVMEVERRMKEISMKKNTNGAGKSRESSRAGNQNSVDPGAGPQDDTTSPYEDQTEAKSWSQQRHNLVSELMEQYRAMWNARETTDESGGRCPRDTWRKQWRIWRQLHQHHHRHQDGRNPKIPKIGSRDDNGQACSGRRLRMTLSMKKPN